MTGRLIYADEDGPGWRQRMRRRQADRDFLEFVRHGGLGVLLVLERNHKNGPAWKRIAIERAIARHGKESR